MNPGPPFDPELAGRVRAWIADDPDTGDRAELQALLDAGDDVALRARFERELHFGTAGLRGPLRAGPGGMNRAVVRRTSAGVAEWARAQGGGIVVIGYDARHRSDEFAREAAAVLRAAGLEAHLAAVASPTPLTAFAVRNLGAVAGIHVTASHNPATDNGYKVYDATGAQILPDAADAILDAVRAQPRATAIPVTTVVARPVTALVEAYRETAVAVIDELAADRAELRAVYTPLHGVGGEIMLGLLRDIAVDVRVVESQFTPDPQFPGLPFPNPEEPGVLDTAMQLARECEAGVVIANDPDADRLAVGVESPVHGWRRLSGDEVGLWLGDHVMARRSGAVARSEVSARALDVAAAARGRNCLVTPTGFKWLSRAADGTGEALAFAYEEALGYAVGPAVRDKDGITAGMLACALASRASPLESLAALAVRDGLSVTALWTAPLPAGGNVPAGTLVVERPEGRVLVRASGTEPKVKCYVEVRREVAVATASAYEHSRTGGLADCERLCRGVAAELGLTLAS